MCLYLKKIQKFADKDVAVVKCVCKQSYWHKLGFSAKYSFEKKTPAGNKSGTNYTDGVFGLSHVTRHSDALL